jgi:hypothetical protein
MASLPSGARPRHRDKGKGNNRDKGKRLPDGGIAGPSQSLRVKISDYVADAEGSP